MSKNLRRALFLDRDGVINLDHGYVHKPENFDFIPGIFDLCRAALTKKLQIFIVTNQAGIGKGYYTEDDFFALNSWLLNEFAKRRVTITKIYHCPFHKDAILPKYKQDSEDRKPKPGMILKANQEFKLDLKNSIMIGDQLTDIEAARNAGIGKKILFNNLECKADDVMFCDVFSRETIELILEDV